MFRIGRKHAAHGYPETSRGSGAGGLFARNFASGPAALTTVPNDGVQIPWNVIDSGAAAGVDVPITPHVTGRFLISGTVALQNTSATSVNVKIAVQVNGVSYPVPANAKATLGVAPSESVYTEVIPFETLVPGLVPGTSYNIQVFVDPNDLVTTLSLVAASSTIEIQEVPGAS